MTRTNVLGLILCSGLATSAAFAAPSVINLAGASLLENYLKAPAATNDFIDVDGDGISGSAGTGIQQLAPTTNGNNYSSALKWIIQYRVSGSVTGLKELIAFGSPNSATGDDTNVNGIIGQRPSAGIAGEVTTAYVNRVLYINGGAATGVYNQGNPGGAPYRQNLSTSLAEATWAAAPTGSSGAIRIDIAPVDVSSNWGLVKPGATNALRKPTQAGYGANPRLSVARDGSTTGFAGLANSLPSIGTRNLYNGNPAQANANTIFDNPLSYAVIAPVVNPGTGIQQLKITELQHLFATGRTITGENLHAVTRDVGSGTRNAFMNSIGVDPSFGVGDNIGGLSTLTVNNNLGAQFTSANKNTSGGMEGTLRNDRLGVGYLGAERGVSGSGSQNWLNNNALEIPSIQNDIYGNTTTYTRPTIDNILLNTGNGWVIGGAAVLATIGDPKAEPIALGGQGLSTPRMTNTAAAAFINNTTRSITAFVSVPGDASNIGMPGEYAATQFTLRSALLNVPSEADGTIHIPNSSYSQAVNDYTRANSIYAINASRYANPNFNTAGRAPTRTTLTAPAAYSDGVVGATNYIDQNGNPVSYGNVLSLRNKITGDFNGDGLRNIDDTLELLKAYRSRNGGPAWVAPTGTGSIAGAAGGEAVIEILGDFDGNGSLNVADVRYFADGLAIATTGPKAGKLDRKAGFEAVDNAWNTLTGNSNFFGTTLAHGTYAAGASRADVAGPSGRQARGWAPVGADGVIDANDINYVFKQFRQNPAAVNDGVDWTSLEQAATFDLSCDITGDLKVDINDINELLAILGTTQGDVNLDGVVDTADLAIITANQNTTGGWAQGDINGDGLINQADIDLYTQLTTPPCLADRNGDATVDGTDFVLFINSFAIGDVSIDATADVNTDGTIDGSDFVAFINAFALGC